MDFVRALDSESPKAQCAAALLLRSEGPRSAIHLRGLLSCCQKVSIDDQSLLSIQKRLVAYGARSLGTIVHAIGFDSEDDLHKQTSDWLIRLTSNRHVQIAGFAIHALGDLGIPPQIVQQRLEDLIAGPKRIDDLPTITCRGTAFRILAALDRSIATQYTDTPAAREYLAALDRWLAAGSEDPKLHDDLKWLRAE